MKEFKNGQTVCVEVMGEIVSRVYVGKIGDLHAVSDAFGKISTCDNNEIDSKPKETFIDVEINWNGHKAYIELRDTKYVINNAWPICSHVEGLGMLSKYLFDDQSEGADAKFTAETPVLFNNDGTKIAIKATHARFIKIT